MPMVWNEAADAKLFAGVLATNDLKIDYKALAAYMGPECTPKALTHRITNIKAKAKDIDLNAIMKSTPTPITKKRKSTKKDVAEATGGGDSDEIEDTPTKKKSRTPAKGGRKKGAPNVKDEATEEIDGVVRGDDQNGDMTVDGDELKTELDDSQA